MRWLQISMGSIKNILTKYRQKLFKISSTPQLDVEVILSFAINKPKEFLYTYPEYKLNQNQLKKFNNFINRRLKSEPIAYIIGEKEFYGLNFKVNKNTLIPRPETEQLVDAAIKELQKIKKQKMILIDVGAGSGCIPISIIKNLPKNIKRQIQIYATDISSKALIIAKQNARLRNIEKEIKFIKSDLLKFFLQIIGSGGIMPNSNIIITANLPYISNLEYKKLPVDIKKYEPKNSLIAGTDGLKYYRRLFRQIQQIKSQKIALIIEIDFISMCSKSKMEKTIKQFLPDAYFEIKRDFSGSERVIVIKKG